MRRGDLVILYHPNATPPGAAGGTRIVGEGEFAAIEAAGGVQG
jgi:predicted RNA-binding protein with PUA-like domain